jgi:ribonuclease R
MEKKADELEKKSTERKRLDFYNKLLKNGKSATFNGFIVGIKKRGMVIELPDSLQRGMVAFKSIRSEWLEADETLTRVENQDGAIRYKLGDPLEVMIAKVDMERALLDFALTGEPTQKSNRSRKRRIEPDQRSGRPKIHSKQRRRRKKR